MHFDRRHPYERFMDRLSATGRLTSATDSQFARLPVRQAVRSSQFLSRHRLRVWLYGGVTVLVLATLLWSGQRNNGIAVANADSLDGMTASFAAARAAVLEGSTLTPVAMLKIAAPLIETPQRELAIELLTEANHRDPTIRDVNLQLGYAYLKEGRVEQAKLTLERAKTLDSIYPDTYRLLATVNHQLGDKAAEQEALARAKQFELVSKLPELTR